MRYLIPTAHGVVLVSHQSHLQSPPSSGHWKALSQFICLSLGLWNSSDQEIAPFSFTTGGRHSFVVAQIYEGHTLFSCVELEDKELETDVQPWLLAFYLLRKFLNTMTSIDDSDDQTVGFVQFLKEIAQRNEQGVEATFADSVGAAIEEICETLLADHDLTDSVHQFEDSLRTNESFMGKNPLYLRWFRHDSVTKASKLGLPSLSLGIYVVFCGSSQTVVPLFSGSIFTDSEVKNKAHSVKYSKRPTDFFFLEEIAPFVSQWWSNGDHATACVSLSKGRPVDEQNISIIHRLSKFDHLALVITDVQKDSAVADGYQSLVYSNELIFGFNSILVEPIKSLVASITESLERDLIF